MGQSKVQLAQSVPICVAITCSVALILWGLDLSPLGLHYKELLEDPHLDDTEIQNTECVQLMKTLLTPCRALRRDIWHFRKEEQSVGGEQKALSEPSFQYWTVMPMGYEQHPAVEGKVMEASAACLAGDHRGQSSSRACTTTSANYHC